MEKATRVGSTLSGAIARCGTSGYVGCDALNQKPIAVPGTSTAIIICWSARNSASSFPIERSDATDLQLVGSAKYSVAATT